MFARARNFSDNELNTPFTLSVVEPDSSPKALSERMKELMRAKGLVHPDGRVNVAALHEHVEAVLKARQDGGKKTITRQTVSNWVAGQAPKLEDLPYLAKVLDTEREYILFGSKRGEQLKRERQYLVRASDEEMALLTAFREASKPGQRLILRQAKTVAEEQPSPEATVHPMRRKDDYRK